MKNFYLIFIAFLFLFVGCENNQQIVYRKKFGIIPAIQEIDSMLYTRDSEYIKLIDDRPLFAVCMFDTKTEKEKLGGIIAKLKSAEKEQEEYIKNTVAQNKKIIVAFTIFICIFLV